ncbi:hypothetical protein SpCBS45565_g05086 [Spizellomyces sp. 'palustris']|nr:hypothetical protein SpCBS45565_g05086 [Spizellomyces sp. 'palustris']
MRPYRKLLPTLKSVRAPSRNFTTTFASYARKKQTGAERRDENDFAALSGDTAADGLHRYELDFVETAKWTRDLLLKMKKDVEMLKGKHRPFSPPPTSHIVTTYYDSYTYDFTQPPPYSTKVTVQVKVGTLPLTPAQRHKFLLLAGENYDPYSDVVAMSAETSEVAATGNAEVDREMNRIGLVKLLNGMVNEAKDEKDAFTDVPLDLRHVKPRRANLEFPKEWLRPKTAEIVKPEMNVA